MQNLGFKSVNPWSSWGKLAYSASYINAGFSGGAVVFPLADGDWTIVGIVTHFPTVKRSVYRGGVETGDYVKEILD